ncbi:hypothetical protein NSS71_08610 [Niallia sp. FSL W8-0951]|uniref:hypothetical protein n=1 Tax=Niallia sp. FSL W8-0951 TaxID=2954639 RepID=UPI0030F55AAF
MKIIMLGHLNDPLIKKKVIKNAFPMKVPIKVIRTDETKVKSKITLPKINKTDLKFNLKIKRTPLVTYKMKPTPSTTNEKVFLLLDYLSDTFQELAYMGSQFKFSEEGITLPTQNKLFFETKITNSEYTNYVTFPKSIEEETLQTMNFTWHKASKIKVENPIPERSNTTVAFDIRLKHTSALALSMDKRLKEKPIRELIEQSQSIKKGEEVFIQFGIQPAEFDWWKEAKRRKEGLSKRVAVTESSNTKLGAPAFDCCLRVIVKGESIRRSEMISRGIILALKQLNGDNELIECKIKNGKLAKWYKKYLVSRKIETYLLNFNKRMLLTRKEIKNFIKLPERNIQKDFNLGIDERQELSVNKMLTKKDGILIGHTEDKGKQVEIRLPSDNLDALCNTNILTGSPRMGKDTAAINMIVEFANTINAGAIVPDVIDEKGNGRGMCDSLLESLPSDRIIDINLGDYNNPVYFGLEDVANLIGINGMNVIADNFTKVLGLEDTTTSQEICSLIAKVCKCNLYDMYCCLKSKQFANSMYEIVKEEDELLALEYYHDFLNAKNDKAIATVKTRLKMILGNPHFKHMIAQEPNKNMDIEKWIRERKIVLLRMKKVDIGDICVQILMYLLTMKVFWIKKIIQTDDPTLIVFNEPHQFMSDGFQELAESMMAECPKYRLCINWLFHNPNQLPDKLWNIMRSSSCNNFIFKNTNWKIYNDLKEQLLPIEVETAMKTNRYESIFMPFINGMQLDPFFVKMLPPPIKRGIRYSNCHLTEEHTKIYGTPVEKVRKRIMEIELAMYSESA